jgi:hypothetical protein
LLGKWLSTKVVKLWIERKEYKNEKKGRRRGEERRGGEEERRRGGEEERRRGGEEERRRVRDLTEVVQIEKKHSNPERKRYF